MLKNLHSSLLIGITGVFLLIFTAGCDKDMSVALDSDSVDALNLTMIDSMTPQIETVMLPSVPTSGNGAILLGKFSRDEVGSVSSIPYFRVAPETFANDIPSGATFESVELVLNPHPNHYFHGDTTQTQTVAIHRLTQQLELTTLTPGGITNNVVPIYVDGPSIFSHQTFDYDSTPLGTLSFTPSLRPEREVSVPLDDAFGLDLFDKIINNASEFQSESNFTEYLNGLVIIPEETNTALIAYNDSVHVSINYSYIGSDGFQQTGAKRFFIQDHNYKYNQFEYDGGGTVFDELAIDRPLRQQETNGTAFYQAGLGVGVKIDFPSLREFMYMPDIAINKVEMEIEIENDRRSLDAWGAPILLIADHQNTPISFVSIPFSPTAQQGQYVPGDNTGRNGRFIFNLIEYIKLINDPNHLDNRLILSVGPPSLFNTASAAVIATDNNRPKIKLNIFYTKFE